MSNYIITTDNELMHYGVKGMKWGQRRARKFADKADLSRAAASEWERRSQEARLKSNKNKFAKRAAEERSKADIFDRKSKGTYSRRSDKLKNKARIAKESAKEWDEMSRVAKERGKIAKSEKYAQNARKDRHDAKYYEEKSKKIVKNKISRKKYMKDVSAATSARGKKAVDKVKNKLANG